MNDQIPHKLAAVVVAVFMGCAMLASVSILFGPPATALLPSIQWLTGEGARGAA